MANERPGLPFDEVVAKHSKRLFNMILRLTQDYEDALDLTQDALIQAYRAYPKFRGESEVFTWLYRIGLNRCRRAYRKKQLQRLFLPGRRLSVEEADVQGELSQDDREDPATAARKKIVQEKVESLPRKYKEAIILKYYEDLSYEEMAQVLNVSVGTVKSRLSRARVFLEKKLKHVMDSGAFQN